MPSNRVRIIGGALRSRVLRFPSLPGLRPTPDRVRETLFNWLGQDLTGRHCLDLYAGSGALGLEAASRGAASVVLVDSERAIVDALAANARALGMPAVEAVRADALHFLASDRRRYDVVFVDPPYASAQYDSVLAALMARTTADVRVYLESASSFSPPSGWSVLRQFRAGNVHAHLLRRDS
ncbi:MAG: 16S rRNA (guanine(966)-N(2))-methyltransferase RsmD [Betaproteobacteria bacterium]|nr:16S rRNA (guanine(966)-N(2))-methyltransferase RsmD [Betaproteobacteria bacterium]